MARRTALIECVPNFSEGRDMAVVRLITDAIESVDGVRLLDVDPGKATNRTVVTFVGSPEAVVEAAVRGIGKAAEVIDMRRHRGEHPRMGATDVCPLVPVAGLTMAETVAFARELGRRVGDELGIPVYLYEHAATSPERRNLATVRAGEYEGLAEKLTRPEWRPDFGPVVFNATAGATVIGARDFLVAYNVNLNTTSTRWANAIAFDVREKGRPRRIGDPVTGQVVRDAQGEPEWVPGRLRHVKGIGWFIPEYGIAQVSLNLTNIRETPVHVAFEETARAADERGVRVTGSELVGLIPLEAMLEAGRHFLRKQRRSTGVSEAELVRTAVRSLGLSDLAPFDPDQKIIEYRLRAPGQRPLAETSLEAFAETLASESPAPGGGSSAAYVGALGAALGTMVANLSAHKRGWDDRWATFSNWADRGQAHLRTLLALVDDDTRAFNAVLAAFRLPGGSDEERAARDEAVQTATRGAIEVPLAVMRAALESMDVAGAMAESGNPNSVSDAAVGALCARAAVRGAWFNVRINMPGVTDRAWASAVLAEGERILADADALEHEILARAEDVMRGDGAAD